MSIHIDYGVLDPQAAHEAVTVDHELLRKAKGWFGGSARARLIRCFDLAIRDLASELSQQQCDPVLLYEAGARGVLDALEIYQVDNTKEGFGSFAMPIIRQHMIQAREHLKH